MPDEPHLRAEANTMALYVALCLISALVALPESTSPKPVLGVVWGATVGLAIAHWFAFLVASRTVDAGHGGSHVVRAGLAQLTGALVVAGLASLTLLLAPASVELEVAELVLAGFIGMTAFLAAISGGTSRGRALG